MKRKLLILAAFAATVGIAAATDAIRCPRPCDVRLEGPLAEKMNRFLRNRVTDGFLRETIFDEARRAFVLRDDDERPWDGQWRCEFWGKSMLSAARVALYRDDADLKRALAAECRRLMATKDADGYIGSYASMTNCSTPPAVVAEHKGGCTNWNLWNRKYMIWGLLAGHWATGEADVLAAAAEQMEQLIDMVHRHGIRLPDTGHYTLNGMPTMSILKPLLQLYAATGREKFLAFAHEIVREWDRDDGRAPNFYRNAAKDRPLYAWYPKPDDWAKTYEMLSCLDGLVEFHRVTGDVRTLETVKLIRDNLAVHDGNAIGGLGISDRLLGAETFPYASTEVCDVVHWMRLNLDLYLVTGDDRYLDSVEFSYFNAFLAGISRDGVGVPLLVRDAGRHRSCSGQCGYAYHQCCLDNAPRAFMDVASVAVTRGTDGVFRVNLYQDATVKMDGVTFEIRGGYPARGTVTVKVSDPAAKVAFRRPGWCPKLDVTQQPTTNNQQPAATYRLVFDMNPRIHERKLATSPDTPEGAQATRKWGEDRYVFVQDPDLRTTLPKEPYATVEYGPLVLARAARLGATKDELKRIPGVNGRGYALKLRPIEAEGAYAPFEVELAKPGEPTVRTKACAYESASDDLAARGGFVFSVRF